MMMKREEKNLYYVKPNRTALIINFSFYVIAYIPYPIPCLNKCVKEKEFIASILKSSSMIEVSLCCVKFSVFLHL